MSKLFSSLQMRSLSLRNRVFVAPMCQYSCRDGIPDEWHLVHLGSRAVGGAGLVMVEATAVTPDGRISPSDCGLWNDTQAKAFEPITRFISAQGAIPAIQLSHAGRKASTQPPWQGGAAIDASDGGWQPWAPSPVPFGPEFPEPSELSTADLDQICTRFEEATLRALSAGFQAIEVHMAHGYLLHQFLSPLSNHRNDDFGGDLKNRMRFPLQVTRCVRETWPKDLPVMVRISATDWVDGGWDLAQSLELCQHLKDLGIDLVDCSSGGLVPDAVIPVGPGFQTPLSAKIRAKVNISTGAVGLITEPFQAEQIVSTGLADVVFLGRELLRNPYWPIHAAQTLEAAHLWPLQYERAKL